MPQTAQTIQMANEQWLLAASERNYPMPPVPLQNVSGQQVVDIELESVPGWADAIDVAVQLDINVRVNSGGTAPQWSPFAPWNFFNSLQLSLGGGPFQNVSPFFYFLRESVMHPGWAPSFPGPYDYSYASQVYNLPPISATPGGSPVDLIVQFVIRVPLQIQHGSVYGHLPLGNSSVKAKLRLTLQQQLNGVDAYLNPTVGGSGVVVSLGTAQTSYVQPTIWYKTTPPSATQPLPQPNIGYILNVQERATPLTTAGSLVPIKFPDPFKYLRLWHVVIDGDGNPNTADVTAFELDLVPGYPQFNYPTKQALQDYFYRVRRLYRQDLPVGVFVFDMWSGTDPANPNGTQVIDGTIFQTLQTQIAVDQGASVGGSAKIVTYAEALSPVAF